MRSSSARSSSHVTTSSSSWHDEDSHFATATTDAYRISESEHLTTEASPLAPLPALAPTVGRRFERPAQLACYLGLISREGSSGDRTRLGSIAKAGNSHCRHVLVQAALSYRHRPQTSVELGRRQQGQPPAVINHAWEAQQHLHKRFNHLFYRQRPQIAVVAVVRKLVGFLWATMQDVGETACQAA